MSTNRGSIFFLLTTVFSLLFVFCFFCFSIYFDQKNLDKKEALLYEVINQANQTIIEKTTNYLMPAVLIAETTSDLEKAGAIDVTDFSKFEQYALHVFKPHKQLAKFYYADKDGQFIMVYRNEDKTYSTKIVNPHTKKNVIKTRNSFGTVVDIQESVSDYDARLRPWFIGAKDTEQPFWTDVYLFYTGKRPGITAAIPKYDKNNEFSGVFGVDIELEHISEFLESQLEFENSKIYIIDDKNHVISQPGGVSFTTLENGELELTKITKLVDKTLMKVMQRYKSTQEEKFIITLGETNYIASIKDFPDYLGKKWKIVILVPQKEIEFSPVNFDGAYYLFFSFVLFCVMGASLFVSNKLSKNNWKK
jgi:hypothetical protein